MSSIWETLWPATPTFTESNCPDLTSHTYLITGGAGGTGFELAQLLYSKNAFVYIAGRSQVNAERAILKAVEKHPRSTGRIEFWKMELEDLKDVRRSAGEFLAKVGSLNGLVCNAGVSFVEQGRRTPQGHEPTFAINCLSHFLLARYLTPLLISTAKSKQFPANSTRILWITSHSHHDAPSNGVDFTTIMQMHPDEVKRMGRLDPIMLYGQSKAGDAFLAAEWARRYGVDSGVISLAVNPGALSTDLSRNAPWYIRYFMKYCLYSPYYGAITDLYALCSPDINQERQGTYIIPWGRFGMMRKDIVDEICAGARGNAAKFWGYCEELCREF